MTRAISPEMRHRGFVPASPSKDWRRGDMLRPKPTPDGRRGFVPAVDTVALNWALADVTPIERQALEYIVENADLIAVEGGAGFLLIEAPPKLLDILATVGASSLAPTCRWRRTSKRFSQRTRRPAAVSFAAFATPAPAIPIPRSSRFRAAPPRVFTPMTTSAPESAHSDAWV